MRLEVNTKGALFAKHHKAYKNKRKEKKGQEGNSFAPVLNNSCRTSPARRFDDFFIKFA
jgi:hypothetical protein